MILPDDKMPLRTRGSAVAVVAMLALSGCVDETPTSIDRAVVECERGPALTLTVGQTTSADGNESSFCVAAAQGGTFLLMPLVAGPRDTLNRVTVKIFGGGMADPPATFNVAASRPAQQRDAVLALIAGTDALDAALRARERSLRALPGARFPGIVGAFRVPQPGDLLQLNTSTNCAASVLHTARVVDVSSHAIVAADPGNPTTGGFTDDQLRQFGAEFDQLVYPVITDNFGTPTDIDGNQRTILYFTRAVNEIPIPGSSAALAAGFFWRGDLFPRSGSTGNAGACPSSNEAEVLFLAVPDSLGEVRVPVSRGTLLQVMTSTIGHEFQHLINTGRKLHVVSAPTLEETWLNEGMSFIAEELLFYAASGFTPKQNIDTTTLYSRGATNAFNKYMYGNMGRLNVFVQAPQDWSLMGSDAIATRGATWSFLRYVADRDPRPDAQLFRALTDATTAGLDNLTAALGQDPKPWMRDWAVSVFADDYVSGIEPRLAQPSWNARELIAALRLPDQRYPLRLLPITSGEGFSVQLKTGSAAYSLFKVAPGKRAAVLIRGENAATGQQIVNTLMRVE